MYAWSSMRANRPRQRSWPAGATTALALALTALRPMVSSAESVAALTRERAIERALARNPELASAVAEVRARGGRTVQQDRSPNPELRADVENVAGSGARRGTEATESTLRVAQRIELGGKRSGRRRVAELDEALASFDLEEKRIAVVAAVSKAFVEALAADERIRLADAMARIADRAVGAVSARVDAGAASPVDLARARVDAARADAARSTAAQEAAVARSALAAACGDLGPEPGRLAGALARLPSLPSLSTLQARLDHVPAIGRWQTELDERDAALALARAGAVPDVTVGVGGRYFSDDGDGALVFDVTVPLPVFDRNQGAIAEAEARRLKARAERAAARVALAASVASAHARLAGVRAQVVRLRDRIVPEASRAVEGMLGAERQGGTGTTDVLAAQRTLFEVQSEYVTALETAHVLAAELDRLTATAPPTATEGDRP